MAKNIRWQVTFKSLNGTTYYVNIYDNDWPAGVVMPVRGATDPFYFEENNSDDLLNSVLRYRTGYIRVIEDSFGDLNDIYPSSKFDRYVECVTGNTVVFNGYIQVQDFQRPLTPGPRTLELPVISPLGLFNECAFNPITPPETTTLGELLDMTLGAGTYTKVVFPIITGAELGKKIFSLVVSPWNTDFHHSMTVDAYHKVMKPETYAYLVEGICKAFGWICHDTPQALVFTSFDHLGLYASYPKGHIGESGQRQSESVTQTEESVSSHFTPADANATMHKILPDTGVEVGYEGDFGRMQFTFDRALYNGVETFPGMTPDDGEMWSVCNFYPVQQLYEFSAASNVGFDQDGHVTRGPHCVAWNGNIGLLYSLFGSTDYDGQTLFTIRHYTKKRTGDRWAVTFKGMTSNNGNGGYVYTIGALKDDDKVTEYYVQAEKTIYDDYIEVAFKYHFDNVSGSVYPQLPAYTLIFIYDIQFEYIENEELYAEYRFAPAEDSDDLPSSVVHPVISSSVTMPFSMYRLNDHMIGDTLLSTKLTEYPYLFQPRMEMQGKFRGTSVPDLYHAMMWGYMSKKWRIIAMDFHPWDDEYILTMQSSPVLSGGPEIPTYTIIATALHTSLSGYNETVDEGDAFTHQLTADSGWEIGSVTILMGNEDITSSAYNSSTGAINIASVTGNVSILVTAEQWEAITWDTTHVYKGKNVGSTLSYISASNYHCFKVPCQEGDVFRVTGVGANDYRLWVWLNSSDVIIDRSAADLSATNLILTAPPTGAYLVVNAKKANTHNAYKKLS